MGFHTTQTHTVRLNNLTFSRKLSWEKRKKLEWPKILFIMSKMYINTHMLENRVCCSIKSMNWIGIIRMCEYVLGLGNAINNLKLGLKCKKNGIKVFLDTRNNGMCFSLASHRTNALVCKVFEHICTMAKLLLPHACIHTHTSTI